MTNWRRVSPAPWSIRYMAKGVVFAATTVLSFRAWDVNGQELARSDILTPRLSERIDNPVSKRAKPSLKGKRRANTAKAPNTSAVREKDTQPLRLSDGLSDRALSAAAPAVGAASSNTPVVTAKGKATRNPQKSANPLGDSSIFTSLTVSPPLTLAPASLANERVAGKDATLALSPTLRAVAASSPPEGKQQNSSPQPAVLAETRTNSLPQPTPPPRPEDIKPGPAAAPPRRQDQEIPDLSDVVSSWAIPPIRWGGTTSSIYNWIGNSDTRTLTQSQALSLRASSYIYQPWYAQVSGNFGLVTGDSQSTTRSKDSSTASSASSTSKSGNLTATYGGNLSLFPQSRYPFSAYVGFDDSRAKASETSSHFTSSRFGARQSYRPEDGGGSYNGSYDHSTITSASNRSIVDALQGTYSTSFGEHSLNATSRLSMTSGDAGGQTSSLFNASANHTWRNPEEGLSISSNAVVTNNETRMMALAGLSQSSNQMFQFGSSFSWTPDEDLPLLFNGGGSLFQSGTKVDGSTASSTNMNGFLNTSYRFSDRLAANGSVTVNQNSDNQGRHLSSQQNAFITYAGTPLTFGNFSYHWGGSANGTNTYVSQGKGNRTLAVSGNHALGSTYNLSPTNSISLTLSESASTSITSSAQQVVTLGHNAGVAWRSQLGEMTAGSLVGNIADTMSFGPLPTHNRSYATQGSIQSVLTSRSSLAGGVNFVYSQQIKKTESDSTLGTTTSSQAPGSLSGSGSLTYNHRSPFNVPNLNYTASVNVNATQSNLRLTAGDTNASIWQTSFVLQQTVDYRMGKLVFRGTASFSTAAGKENASLFGMVTREIGD